MAGKTSNKSAASKVKASLKQIGSAAQKDVASLAANHKKEIDSMKKLLHSVKKSAAAEIAKLKKQLQAHTPKAKPAKKKTAAKKAPAKKAPAKKAPAKKAPAKKAPAKKAPAKK